MQTCSVHPEFSVVVGGGFYFGVLWSCFVLPVVSSGVSLFLLCSSRAGKPRQPWSHTACRAWSCSPHWVEARQCVVPYLPSHSLAASSTTGTSHSAASNPSPSALHTCWMHCASLLSEFLHFCPEQPKVRARGCLPPAFVSFLPLHSRLVFLQRGYTEFSWHFKPQRFLFSLVYFSKMRSL